MEDVDPHQPQAPWPPRLKVKITRSRGMSDQCGLYYKICIVLWQTYKDAYYRQSRWSPKSKVTSSHHLYVSIYLPLLNSGNKMLYLCHRGGRGHTVSAESGGHTSCSYCNMTTNINVMNSLLLEYFFMSHVVHERSFTQIAWRVPINHKKFSCRRETARASCHWMVW